MMASGPAPGRRSGGVALRRRLRLSAALVGALALGGCVSVLDDVAAGPDGQPRLETGEAERSGPVVDVRRVNAQGMARAAEPFTGYVGSLAVNYAPDTVQLTKDLNDLKASNSTGFDPSERVSVDFQNATIEFVLKQLLGGALGLNYVAPDKLGGSVTFRTETPIPKSRVLDVVRDILARNDLVIRFVNGVYHVGPASVIAALQANSALGSAGEETTRIVRLAKGNAAQVVRLGGAIVPAGVSLQTSSSPNTVVVRSAPTDADSVERLVRTLSDSAIGDDTVAIVPLTQSEPSVIAERVQAFYASTLRGDEPVVSVLPLEAQRAVLVGTPSREQLGAARMLIQQLDRSVSDVSSLRVIPLTHLRAEEIAPQIAQIFGSGVDAPAVDSAPRRLSDPKRNAPNSRLFSRPNLRQQQAQTPLGEEGDDGTGLAVPGPSLAPSTGGAAALDRGGGEVANEADVAAQPRPRSAAVAAPTGGEIRVVPDTRTNTILVYSTYRIFNQMREIVQALDVPQSQVVIEATVLEVQLNDSLDRGVQFFLENSGFGLGSGSPSAVSPTTGGIVGFSGTVGSVSVNAVLTALRNVTNVKVVSSPYLTVLDGRSARLVIGDQIPFATATQSSNNLGNVTVTREIQVVDTGVVMEITPRIHANNSVDLAISQSVSTPVASTSAGADNLTPTIATRDIQSQILVQSGRTVLLGGLIQDRVGLQESQVPVAAEIPVFGNLFKQKSQQARRTELLVMITPRVARTSNEIENVTRLLKASLVGAEARPAAKRALVAKP